MAFEIDEGVVKVTADVDRSSLAKAAREAGAEAGAQLGDGLTKGLGARLRDSRGRFIGSGRDVGDSIAQGAGEGVSKRKSWLGGLIKDAFTPDPQIYRMLVQPFAAVFSTPVAVAALIVGGLFAVTFLGAVVTSLLGLGLGTILLGLGGLALFGGRKDRQEALDDLAKAEKKVKNAEFRARSGSATSIRNLTEARKELAEAQKLVNQGKAFVELDKALDNVGKTLKSVAHQASLPLLKPFTEALNDTSELVRQLGPEFNQIFTSLAPVIPLLSRAFGLFSGEVVRGLRDSMPGITAAFQGLANVLPTVGRWIGDFFREIFENADVIETTTESVFKFIFGPLKLLGPMISGLTVLFGAFNNLVWISAQGWGMVRDALIEFFDGGTGAAGRFKEAWEPLGIAIQAVWDKLEEFAAAKTPEEITATFLTLVKSIEDAWGPLKEFLGVVWDEGWAFVKRVWEENVKPWIDEEVSPWMKEALSTLMEEAWEAAKKMAVKKINELVSSVLGKLTGFPGEIFGILMRIPGLVWNAFSESSSRAATGAKNIVNGAIQQLSQLPGKIGSTLSSAKGRVTGAFSNSGSWLYNAGKSIVQGLINGLYSMLSSLGNAARSLGQKIKDNKGPIEADRVMLVPEGQAIVEGLINGVNSKLPAIQSTFSTLTQTIRSHFVQLGQVSEAAWDELLNQGWKGNASDGIEAVYSPIRQAVDLAKKQGFLKYGQASQDIWKQLLDLGWKGKANDKMEAIYAPAGFKLPAPAMSMAAPAMSSSSSSSAGSMAPSFNVQVYVGDREIKDIVRVEISEHDRSLDSQVSSGTGGFWL